jgi:hypothetical protein
MSIAFVNTAPHRENPYELQPRADYMKEFYDDVCRVMLSFQYFFETLKQKI